MMIYKPLELIEGMGKECQFLREDLRIERERLEDRYRTITELKAALKETEWRSSKHEPCERLKLVEGICKECQLLREDLRVERGRVERRDQTIAEMRADLQEPQARNAKS